MHYALASFSNHVSHHSESHMAPWFEGPSAWRVGWWKS